MKTTDPKSLPNYTHPNYDKLKGVLKVLEDVYSNLEGCKSAYLKQEPKEPKQVYDNRVDRAVFNNKLTPTIESNAGLLTAFELADAPASVQLAVDDIDGKGSDLKTFFKEADIKALRDGLCYVLIDYPPADGAIVTEADRQQSDRRPYLVLIDRRNVLNWKTHHEAGKQVIDSVVIRFDDEVEDGEFATKPQTLYHQLKRKLIADPESGEPEWRVEHIIWEIQTEKEQIAVVKGRSLLTLSEIPLIAYPYTSKAFNTDNPPFLKLARLNVKLFRKESALDEIEYRVNIPTVWRKHPTEQVPDNLPPVTLGASWVIEVPNGGEVGVLEIQGNGIAALQASIDGLKAEIDNEGLGFLAGSQVQRTATEAFLSSAQVNASLSGMARDKASAIQRCFDYWCQYTGEENSTTIEMDASLLEMPLDAQEMGVLMGMWQAGAIAHETLLDLLKMGKQLPPSFDVKAELQKLEDEQAKQMAAQQASLEQLLNNDTEPPAMQRADTGAQSNQPEVQE